VDKLSFYEALGQVAPYYNLGFVVIVICLFVWLFKIQNKRVYLLPWYCIFAALGVFIVEEVITILRAVGLLSIPVHINGFFELIMITLFIYAVLSQKEHVKEVYNVKKSSKLVKKTKKVKKKKRK